MRKQYDATFSLTFIYELLHSQDTFSKAIILVEVKNATKSVITLF